MTVLTNFKVPAFVTNEPLGWQRGVGETWWAVLNGLGNFVSSNGSTEATYRNLSFSNPTDLGLRIKLIGTDFAFSNGVASQAGTLNQLELHDADGSLVSRITLPTGISLVAFLNAGTSSQKAQLLFNGGDTFSGHAGNDYMAGYGGSDTLIGGEGDDFLSPGNSPRNRSIRVEPQADSVDGGAGNDTTFLDYRNRNTPLDLIFSGHDTDAGQTLSDGTVLRNIENVQVIGGIASDTILGGNGNDVIMGGSGADSLNGGAGNDHLAAFALPDFGFNRVLEADTIDGGEGIDMVSLGASSVNFNISIDFGQASTAAGLLINALTLVRNVERFDFTGGTGNDLILGGAYSDILSGGNGFDTLIGGSGADTLSGGDGNDLIIYDAEDIAVDITGGNGFDILEVVGGSVPTGFNFLVQGFERAHHNQTDTTNQSWSIIRDIYTDNWARMASNIFFDNGTRQDRNFDSANNRVYTEYVDFYLDVAVPNSVTRQFIFEDAGTRQERLLDYKNDQSYTEYLNFYADITAINVVTRQVVFDDARTMQERIFDHNNTQAAYSEYINFYDSVGYVKRQVGINDAGGVAWEYFY